MTFETETIEDWIRSLVHAKNLSAYDSDEYRFYREWINALIDVVDRRLARSQRTSGQRQEDK